MDTTVEFMILGQLEVRVGGHRLDLRGARQETALAALLLDAGRIVTFDQLVDAVWDDPPRTARRQIQDLVTRLRRGIEICGARPDLLTTHRRGYVLMAKEEEFDAMRFERLVAAARIGASANPDTSAGMLRAALMLCRDRTLAGIASRALEPAIARWEETVSAVREEHLAVELALGNHPLVLNELSTLVVAHPMRERLVELLMLTLQQGGRRPEALDAYRQLRERLAEGLGLEPSIQLQDLHRAILQGRTSHIEASSTITLTSSKAMSATTAQLPLDIRGFTGRDHELSRLDQLLAAHSAHATVMVCGPATVVMVSGMSGVGKTALVVHWSHRVRDRFPDGRLHVDLHGFDPSAAPTPPEDAVRRMLDALGLPAERIPATFDAQVAVYRSLLATRKMLVVLDNARDAQQVRPLLPGGPNCFVIITSRDQLTDLAAEGAIPLPLSPLAAADADGSLDLHTIGRGNAMPDHPHQLPMVVPDFVGREAELAEMLEVVAGPPGQRLAPPLVVVSGLAGAGKTAVAIQAATRAMRQYPDGCVWADLRAPDGTPTDPCLILGAFLRALGVEPTRIPDWLDERRGLFRTVTAQRRLLVILDDAHDEAQVRHLLPASPGCAVIVTSRSLLTGLDGAQVVALAAMPGLEATQLLQTAAGRSVTSSDTGLHRIVDLCAGLPLALRIAGARLRSRPDLPVPELARMLSDERSRLDALHLGDRNVRASLMLTYAQLEPSVQRLLCLLSVFPGKHFSVLAVSALIGQPTRARADPLQQLIELHMLEQRSPLSDGQTRYQLHDLVRLFAAERCNMEIDQQNLATALQRLLAAYQDALAAAARALLGDVDARVTTISANAGPGTIFPSHREASDWLAIEHDNLRALLKRAVTEGMHQHGWRLAAALHPYYRSQHLIGEWLATLDTGLSCAEAAGDRLGELVLREHLGLAHIERRQATQARRHLLIGLQLATALGDETARGRCLDNIGVSYGMSGNMKQAENHIRRALAVPDYAAHPRLAASALTHLALVHSACHDLDAAEETLRQVLARCRAIEDWRTTCYAHHNLAEVLLKKGMPASAREHLTEELRIARDRRLPEREARACEVLGDSFANTQPARARDYWRQALDLYRRLGHENATAVTARLQALLHKPAAATGRRRGGNAVHHGLP